MLGAATAIALVSAPLQSAQADTLEGAILRAQYAVLNNDFASAARFHREALAFAPDAPELLRPAFYFSLLVGDLGAAARVAGPAAAVDPTDKMARLAMIAEALRDGRGAAAEALLTDPAALESLLPITRRILLGWAAHVQGEPERAAEVFTAPPPAIAGHGGSDTSAQERALATAYELFGQTHLGLMAAADGDDARAVEAFAAAREAAGNYPLRTGLEAAGALTRLGQVEEATAIYGELLARLPDNPLVIAALEASEKGAEPTPFVRHGADGAATMLYEMGVSLGAERSGADLSIFYLQLSRRLKPDFPQARLSVAGALVDASQYRLAAETYAGVSSTSPLAELAQIGRAEALARADDRDEARVVLNNLIAAGGDSAAAYLTLGAIEAADRRSAACASAYAQALDRLTDPNWRIFYQKGACHEQNGDWPSAEAAFTAALEIEPRQPDVLNDFGYGLVVRGKRLDEAREMLEIAVQGRPDSGYIVDSLGWALYRLGDYEAAVVQLEEAAHLAPSEAVIIDHYGDALWRVGRRLEARFQWRRALSYEPSDKERALIERKLEVGLDVALAELGPNAIVDLDQAQDRVQEKVQAPEPEAEGAGPPHDG
ncbi:MAG: tetratricopeptide repeat protein [Pseudomonadota bacterium]